MKHIVIALIICLTPFICFAEEDEVKEPNYQVNITIRYNSISENEAKALSNRIMERHREACKAEVQLKKLSEINGVTETWTIVTEEN